MADRLFFLGSSVQARSLIFPSFYASSCQCHPWRSSKCRVGSRRKKKLVCSCSKPTSFGLVSTSELSDGSIVFRFGNVSETPEDKPQVETSVLVESSEAKDSAKSVVHLAVPEGDHKEEANSEVSPIHALTEAFGSEAVDICSGVFPKKVDDQLVLSGTMDQRGDSHLVAAATPECIDLGYGPFEEIQLKSESSNCFTSDLSIVENNGMCSEENFIENSLEESRNLVFLVDDAVPVVDISDLSNNVEQKADLNLSNQFLFGNISHQSDIIQQDDATSLNQDEAVENEKASAGFRVAVLIGHEEMQTETTVVKRKDTLEMEVYLSSGVASLPHPSKESTGGEDAHFIHGNWLGVADGVGQWSMEGANASSYAQELLQNCKDILSSGKNNSMTDPVEVIVRGARETHSSGLSTVMVASFDGQVLRVAGIGDSGFIIIRNGNVLEKSAPMLHEFNLPLQIHKGIDPLQLIKLYSVRLDEDDVIVLATNGLFDNLYAQEIALIVSDCLQSCQESDEIAQLLAKRAQEVGISKSGRSPFADAAHEACYVGYTGGKLDDITVIMSMVERYPDSRS